MIDTKELRIGNVVQEEILGYLTVISILSHTVVVVGKNMKTDGTIEDKELCLSTRSLSPIPITEEILGSIEGFKKDNISQYGGWLYIISEQGEAIRIVNNEHGYNWPMLGHQCAKTPYLHKLQNLIFSLTGKEAEYKPK